MDELEFEEETAKSLERVYQTRDVIRRRALVREALAARPGERILDAGCGPGFYVAEILEQVGTDGFVVGVDLSEPMLELAKHRVGDAPNARFEQASAAKLPFDDGGFDAVVSVQVLEYVEDVPAALSELRRVLRPGGRLVIWDVDWASVSMHSRDPARMSRALQAWDRHLIHRTLPRTLVPMFAEAGFEDVVLAGHSFTTAEFTFEAYGGSLVSVIESFLLGLQDFPDDEASAWADEQRELGEAGEFYFACVQCCVTGSAPTKAS